MSFEEFKSIVDQFPSLKWIGLTGIGESFLNKDFMTMLRYVKSRNILVELYDNFLLIDEKVARPLVEIGVDRILVSLDGATKETYEAIRVGSNFEHVLKNVKCLFQIRKEKNTYFPQIDFHFIVTKVNIHEIPQYIELVHSLVDNERASVQFTRMLHEFSEIKNLFVEIPEETIEVAEEKAKELGIGITWNADVPPNKPPIKKCTEWIMPFIFVTGHVIPCCSGNEAGHRDFQKEHSLGNIFEQSFKDIWYGQKHKRLRETLRQGKIPTPCSNCCLYDTG